MPDTCPSARIPMELPTVTTNGITDGPRMHATCLSARIPTVNTDGITDGPRMPDTCPSARIPKALTDGIADGTKKFGGIFDFFGAHFN